MNQKYKENRENKKLKQRYKGNQHNKKMKLKYKENQHNKKMKIPTVCWYRNCQKRGNFVS